MFGKAWKVLIGAVAASLVFGGTAYAAPAAGDGTGEKVRGAGEVTAVGADSFTLQTRRGVTLTVTVGADTAFKDKDGNAQSFADLAVGSHILGAAVKQADGTLLAETVVILPERTTYKGNGSIDAVDADEAAFDFTNLRGKQWEFYVDDAAAITARRTGAALTFADLKTGQRAHVEAELRSDGQWWATQVVVFGGK